MPGQAFTVSYLSDIAMRNFFFIVKNIEQELTESGWETTITALMRRREMHYSQREIKVKNKNREKETNKEKYNKNTASADLYYSTSERLKNSSSEEDIYWRKY